MDVSTIPYVTPWKNAIPHIKDTSCVKKYSNVISVPTVRNIMHVLLGPIKGMYLDVRNLATTSPAMNIPVIVPAMTVSFPRTSKVYMDIPV